MSLPDISQSRFLSLFVPISWGKNFLPVRSAFTRTASTSLFLYLSGGEQPFWEDKFPHVLLTAWHYDTRHYFPAGRRISFEPLYSACRWTIACKSGDAVLLFPRRELDKLKRSARWWSRYWRTHFGEIVSALVVSYAHRALRVLVGAQTSGHAHQVTSTCLEISKQIALR
jgi:hypothetical protein